MDDDYLATSVMELSEEIDGYFELRLTVRKMPPLVYRGRTYICSTGGRYRLRGLHCAEATGDTATCVFMLEVCVCVPFFQNVVDEPPRFASSRRPALKHYRVL